MEWAYGRVDFLPPGGAQCCFCHRPLRSQKGIVVVDQHGTEAFAGPSCAKRELGPPDERILDVARLALLVVQADDKQPLPPPKPQRSAPAAGADPAPEMGGEKRPAGAIPPIAPQVQYLRLRYEIMGRFKRHVSTAMRAAYSNLQAFGELDADSHRMLAGLMRRAEAENSIYSDRNVRRCIGFEHWLMVAMEQTRPDRRDFLVRMLDRLHSEWMLTEGQVNAINKWGEGIRKVAHDFPVLDVKAFSGVKRPDFLKQPRPQSQS